MLSMSVQIETFLMCDCAIVVDVVSIGAILAPKIQLYTKLYNLGLGLDWYRFMFQDVCLEMCQSSGIPSI